MSSEGKNLLHEVNAVSGWTFLFHILLKDFCHVWLSLCFSLLTTIARIDKWVIWKMKLEKAFIQSYFILDENFVKRKDGKLFNDWQGHVFHVVLQSI